MSIERILVVVLIQIFEWIMNGWNICFYIGRGNCTETLGIIKSYQKELDKKPVTKDSTFIEEAARYGCLDILKYLHERGSNLTEECSENAASNGHMDCLRYCHENGCPFSEDSWYMAAKGGYLDCLRFLCEIGISSDQLTFSCMSAAAEGGHLECLRYHYDIECVN